MTFSGLSEDEIKERVLEAMIEAGASPEAIAKVMVQQEILNTIGKSPDDMAKVLLKQLRSGTDITLQDLTQLLKSGGITLEDAGKVTLMQKALSSLNIPIEEIARAALLQKGLLENGTSVDDIGQISHQLLLSRSLFQMHFLLFLLLTVHFGSFLANLLVLFSTILN